MVRSHPLLPFHPRKHGNRHPAFVARLLCSLFFDSADSPLPTAPYGFGVFKPSTLWPPPPPEFRHRAAKSTTVEGLKAAAAEYQSGSSSPSRNGSGHHFANLTTHHKAHELADAVEALPDSDPKAAERHVGNGQGNGPDDKMGTSKQKGSDEGGQNKAEVAEVIRVKVDGEEIELKDQIQLYATNEQVRLPPSFSPVISSVLTSALPIAGLSVRQPRFSTESRRTPAALYYGRRQGGPSRRDHLRSFDSSSFFRRLSFLHLAFDLLQLAHRAAHPEKFPVRDGILNQNRSRSKQHLEYPPTKVRLLSPLPFTIR